MQQGFTAGRRQRSWDRGNGQSDDRRSGQKTVRSRSSVAEAANTRTELSSPSAPPTDRSPRRHDTAARRPDEQRLWRLHAAGDPVARERLVERYLRLAQSLARRYARTSEPLDDLEQVAYLGLVQAVDRFDPARGVAFSSFAVPTILGELKRHFRDRTWAVRVPREIRDAATAVDRVTERLSGELGRSPSAAEVAAVTGLGVEQVIEARHASLAYRCESIDRPAPGEDDDGMTLGDRLGTRDEDLRRAEDGIALEQLAAASLSRRDREVLRLRLREDLLQREIAERVGLSQMQVSRLLREAVDRLTEVAA
jgi:RNA polymerase sigma-B factor